MPAGGWQLDQQGTAVLILSHKPGLSPGQQSDGPAGGCCCAVLFGCWLARPALAAGQLVTWQGAVAVTRAWVSRAIRQDWLRVSDTLPVAPLIGTLGVFFLNLGSLHA